MHRINSAPVSPQSLNPASTTKSYAVADPVVSNAGSATAPELIAQRDDAFKPGLPPVDENRVAVIRKAIEQGNYPVLPVRVADAVIAAGLLLRTGK